MSVAAVCVDRGRVIVKEPSATRLEGRTSFTPVPSQWFKCRLFLTNTTDTPDPSVSHWLSQSAPQVLAVTRDLDGATLVFAADQQMEINSHELGRAIWRFSGEPEPLRKKRRLIGWLIYVERVIEHDFDDLLNENVPALGLPAVT